MHSEAVGHSAGMQGARLLARSMRKLVEFPLHTGSTAQNSKHPQAAAQQQHAPSGFKKSQNSWAFSPPSPSWSASTMAASDTAT